MKKTALMCITINAVSPMMNYIRNNEPELKPVPYVDGYVMEKIKHESGVNNDSMMRMLNMIGNACRDGADGIIITCTMFTPYQPAIQQLFTVPIVSADTAMFDNASKQHGETAILCTFDGTVETTRNGYYKYCRKNNMPEKADMFTLPDAFKAIQAGDFETGNKIIRAKIIELDEQYDKIILAQISMAGGAEGVTTKRAEVYSSPRSAVLELKSKWES